MTAESRWDSTRWRDASQTPQYGTTQQHPQLAGSEASKDYQAQNWYGTSQGQNQSYDYDSRRSSQAYGGHLQQYAQTERQPRSGDYGLHGPATLSNTDSYSESWRNAPLQDKNAYDRNAADAPLSLQIPHHHSELPNVAHGYTTPRSDAPLYSSSTSSWSHHTTSLPSFAALSEKATRNEEPDEVEIAPMSARLSCSQCTKLVPLIREVANGLFELDENVQSLCNTPTSRSPDIPQDSAMRTMQWILDRVRYTSRNVQEVTRQGNVDAVRPSLSALNRLKRSADQWDQDDMPTLKLPRPNPQHGDSTSCDRRSSIDFASRDPIQRSAYSPAPSDSAAGSSYPRPGSPTSGRVPRALPSPSSLAFPPSGPASFVPANANSVGSPGTSYHPESSIHTVSTNSATSAHLQDLQHQVSLKSLALQTLQTEYATLLQKLQRERIKSQTIEKKTTVADQEVNDLTTRNEELSEQIKTLEAQLQESERKRETERADAARDKEQWGRMLDMSGRLQNKNAEDRQRLANEKADLLQRLASYESGVGQPSQSPKGSVSANGRQSSIATVGHEGGFAEGNSSDVAALRRENTALQAKVKMLQSALEEVQRRYNGVEESMLHLDDQRAYLRRAVDLALSGDGVEPERMASAVSHNMDASTAPREKYTPREVPSPGHPDIPTTKRPPEPQVGSPAINRPRSMQPNNDPLSPENLAHNARAVSPGPAELGFHVQTSTSSPEELVQALGPVPAPIPSIRYPSSSSAKADIDTSDDRRAGRRQSQPFIAPLNLPSGPGGELSGMPSFRPLNQAGSPSHSHHSSPCPTLSGRSPPDTTSTRSPEQNTSRRDYSFERRHSQPQVQTAPSPSTAAMPPPPRPLA